MNEIGRLASKRRSKPVLDLAIVMRLEMVGWDFHGHAGVRKTAAAGELHEGSNGSPASPPPQATTSSTSAHRLHIRCVRLLGQHGDRPGRCRKEQTLEFLVALGVTTGKPMNRNGWKTISQSIPAAAIAVRTRARRSLNSSTAKSCFDNAHPYPP